MNFSTATMAGVSRSSSSSSCSWLHSALFLAILLFLSCCCDSDGESEFVIRVPREVKNKGCEEIYVVGEGETLHTISEKCGDPFIVEENPHINDPDDVFPGLVIKITPFKLR